MKSMKNMYVYDNGRDYQQTTTQHDLVLQKQGHPMRLFSKLGQNIIFVGLSNKKVTLMKNKQIFTLKYLFLVASQLASFQRKLRNYAIYKEP